MFSSSSEEEEQKTKKKTPPPRPLPQQQFVCPNCDEDYDSTKFKCCYHCHENLCQFCFLFSATTNQPHQHLTVLDWKRLRWASLEVQHLIALVEADVDLSDVTEEEQKENSTLINLCHRCYSTNVSYENRRD